MKILALPLLGAAIASVMPVAAAQAQDTQRITITGSAEPQAPSVAGFGDFALWRVPFSATVIDQNALRDAGIASFGDITRLDAGFTDAYNAPGYWNQVAVRGYTLDNRTNYRRDGLPINAETVIGAANKQRLEVLKGTSGVQAGTSAPGGLLNLVVKRPRERIREASLGWTQDGTIDAAVDVGNRNDSFGWRVNVDAARLDPRLRASRGQRWLGAVAVDTRLGATLIEAEFEASRQSQPSTPGFSLLGDRLPSANEIDPRINLNNQDWTLPVVMAGRTGSLRLTHPLATGLDLVVHAMRQRLASDDRIAFPFGCYGPEPAPDGTYYADRYCPDGTFDFYDFRSDGERRTSDALDMALKGQTRLAGFKHQFNAGVLLTRHRARFNDLAFNPIGTGTIDGRSKVSPDPTPYPGNTDRDERSTEWYLQDAVALTPVWSLWAGARHTRLARASAVTDGSQATSYRRSFTTPWLAVAMVLDERTQAYASAGEGVESQVVPNLPVYTNAGRPLPALKSRQTELGVKHAGRSLDARVALFDIRRPTTNDFAGERRTDGIERHRGVEAEAEWRAGTLSLRGSAIWLHARREGSADGSLNGLRPTNVPARAFKLQTAWNVDAVPGLALVGFVTHEGERMVLPDNSIATPGWTRIDLAARYRQTMGTQAIVWRLGVDNATDRRAWQEAPYQFGHAYLYPLAPRTLRLSAQFRL